MIYTTTHNVEGKKIRAYHGVVAGEAIVGVNIFKDMFASIRDIVGGRTASYEGELEKAREAAMQDITARVAELGGNALIGIDIDYEVIGSGSGNMLMVSVSGTAVTLS